MKQITVNTPGGLHDGYYVDSTDGEVVVKVKESIPSGPGPGEFTFTPGEYVILVGKAEYCESVIADGKELITGAESGRLDVESLKNPYVKIVFKEGLTDFSHVFEQAYLVGFPSNFQFGSYLSSDITNFDYAFYGCELLKSIPSNIFGNSASEASFNHTFEMSGIESVPSGLFDDSPEAQYFENTFAYCANLKTIPVNLFENNKSIYNVQGLFNGCSSLTGESPYDHQDYERIDVHLYDREYNPHYYTQVPTVYERAFAQCAGLTDYESIPSDWK